MEFRLLQCNPLSVEEVISSDDLDNQHVGVHGIVYYGEGCDKDEFLLLPKCGPFDGVGPIPMPSVLDRAKCLLIDEPDLNRTLGSSSACGSFLWKHDAIVIGQVQRKPGSAHPVRIGELWLLILQHWLDVGHGEASHDFRVIAFPRQPLHLPFRGFEGERHASPIIRIDPWVRQVNATSSTTQEKDPPRAKS